MFVFPLEFSHLTNNEEVPSKYDLSPKLQNVTELQILAAMP
jgi:hypothetical protein